MSLYFSLNIFLANDNIKVFAIIDAFNNIFYPLQLLLKYRKGIQNHKIETFTCTSHTALLKFEHGSWDSF